MHNQRDSERDHSRLRAHAERVAALAAARLPAFASIVWKGSSRKAWRSRYDFIPGVSDIDIHVYLESPVPPGVGGEIEQQAGPGPDGSPTQVMVLDLTNLPPGWMLLPEAYDVLLGRDPEVSLPSMSRMESLAYERLLDARYRAAEIRAELAAETDPWSMLVRLRSAFTPMLYRAAIHLAGHDPTKVWTQSRSEILDATDGTPSLEPLRDAVLRYLDATIAASAQRPDPDLALRALQYGLTVLDVTDVLIGDPAG